MSLTISTDLQLPIDAVTQTFGILAKRGVGKTYSASVMAEEMLMARAQIVVIDPLDSWWGLRAGQKGLPIFVVGGEHGDLPLEAHTGQPLADVVVDENVSVVLSIRHLSKSAQRRFVADFCERLYHRKGEPKHRTPLHLFIDEADAFAPQRVAGDVARAMGAVDDLVRRGRSSGIGVTLITQRAAAINKDVLTQIEVLVALRTVSPQDRKALEAWIEAHDAHDQHTEFMATLATLAIGEAWVWSPGWLDIFQRIQIRKRLTHDSSSTPAVGAALASVTTKPVDLGVLRDRLAATTEKSAQENPAELRKRLAAVTRERDRLLAQENKPAPAPASSPVLTPEQERSVMSLAESVQRLAGQVGDLAADVQLLRLQLSVRSTPVQATARAAPRQPGPSTDTTISKAGRSILAALAQYPDGRTKTQVALLTGYSSRGGGFNNAISALRSAGLLEGTQSALRITDAGLAAGDWEPLPTGDALFQHWLGQLGKAAREILEAVRSAYPAGLTKDELGLRTGYSHTGGGFNNALSRLRTLELIEGSGELRMTDALAEGVTR